MLSFVFGQVSLRPVPFVFSLFPLKDFLSSWRLPHPLASALAVELKSFLGGGCLWSMGVGKEVTCC